MKARGILAQLETFSTFFELKLCFLAFSATEQPSHVLQAKDTTIQEANETALLAESHLRRQRSNTAYDVFYEKTVLESNALTSEPKLQRKWNPYANK